MSKPRLEKTYGEFRAELGKELGLDNIMQVPRVSKIVLNVGVKGGDSKILQSAERVLGAITGQKAVRTKAHKSIAGFKLREGMPIGVKVTLRGKRMYEFLDRLIGFVLPGVRDFQGVSPKFDQAGNYNLGLREYSVFPEVEYDTREKAHGLNITIQTTALGPEHGHALLKRFGMPFRK